MGLCDIPLNSYEVKFVIPKDLSTFYFEENETITNNVSTKIATFIKTSKTEDHFQYGLLPTYNLVDIS